jgi:serine/threonine-protein kinase
MFAADRSLKITDFGIAQVFGGDETVTTVDGGVIGTPEYMAPE